MSFRVFEETMPDIFNLADHAEQIIDINPIIALDCMKEIGRLLIKKILMNENVEITYSDPFINLEALVEIEILPVHLVNALKKLEYFDVRESSLFIDPSQVNKLMIDLYDLTAWYYKTFVDDHFSPPDFLLKPQNSTSMTLPEPAVQPAVIRTVIHIDNQTTEGYGKMELRMLNLLNLKQARHITDKSVMG